MSFMNPDETREEHERRKKNQKKEEPSKKDESKIARQFREMMENKLTLPERKGKAEDNGFYGHTRPEQFPKTSHISTTGRVR